MKASWFRGRTRVEPVVRAPLTILAAAVSSVAAYALLQAVAPDSSLRYSADMIEAAETMQRTITVSREFCESNGIVIDEAIDPNRTCLVGPELTPLMTTLGHLDAKRTTTDPATASLVVHLLAEAGVSRGDTIAVGSSASFPALLFATLAAAEAMEVHPLVIISLGASTYGATNPEFNLLDMYSLMLRKDVFETPPAAISLGGDEDIGQGFDPDLKAELQAQITTLGYRFISEPDLRRNVAARMEIYGGTSGVDRVSAFVNTGGSYANLGTSSLALRLDPGLNLDVTLPPVEERGVLFEMAARNVPVIHLLFVRGLALRHGLPWDPIPLTEPGAVVLHAERPTNSTAVWLLGVLYLAVVTSLTVALARSTKRGTRATVEQTF